MSSAVTGESFLQQLGHLTERPIQRPLGTLKTASRYVTQPVVLTRPVEGMADVPITCAVCQQEVIVRVASRKHLQAFRLRWGVTIAILFVITVALLYASSQLPAGGNLSQFLLAASIFPAFASFLGVVRIFKEGISIKQQPLGAKHQLFKTDPKEQSAPKSAPKKNSLAQRSRK